MTRVGSLCSGYGGLDLGLALALGPVEVAWHVEYDKHPSAILAHHWPHVPNYGDLTALPLTDMEPVEVVTAGFPCQPASTAGKRAGMSDDRWLWDHVARTVEGVRPHLVVLENVPGLLSVDGGRAFERVICDLAALGYVGRYGVVRAADAGAPHGRARVFVVATDSGGQRHGRREDAGSLGRVDGADAFGARERERSRGESEHRGSAATTDSGGGQLPWAAADRDGLRIPAERGPGAAADAEDHGRGEGVAWGRSTELAGATRSGGAAPDADSDGLESVGRLEPVQRDADRFGGQNVAWGAYEPAIRRWERILGRPAPRPTEPGRTGERLSPRFVEWLMGLPAGWVTDVPGLPRNAQLKALGNGAAAGRVGAAPPPALSAFGERRMTSLLPPERTTPVSRTRPDQAEEIMLGFTCGRCAALPEEWCLTSRSGPSALLHAARFWQASAAGMFPISEDPS